jgi:hypothetical protein
MFEGGDIDAGILACGQGVGLCREIISLKALFAQMMVQADGVLQNLSP